MPKLRIATVPAQGSSQLTETLPHRLAMRISEATTLAAAKNGASWARERSWTSLSGDCSPILSHALRHRQIPHREAGPKSSFCIDLELRTSALSSTRRKRRLKQIELKPS